MKYIVPLLFLTLSLSAESLDVLIDYASKHSTVVRQSEAQKELASLQHQKSKADRYGELDAVGSYAHYNLPRTLAPLTPATIGSGEPITTTKDLFSAGLSYNVPLFTGFAQTKTVEIEHLAKQMAEAKRKLTKEQLIYNIRALYLNALSLEEMLKAQKAYTSALETLTRQIGYEVKLGKKAKIDVLKANASLQGSKTTEEVLKSKIAITKAALSSLVGKEVKSLSSVNITMQKKLFSLKKMEEEISDLNKLRVEELSLQKAQKAVSKSKASFFPQVGFSAYLGKNYGEDLQRSEWDNETLWQAGLNMKYNLLDFGKSDIAIQKAKIAKIQASLHKEQTLLNLKKDFTEAIATIEQNYALFLGNKAAQKLSSESEKIEKVRYEHGAATLNDLLLAKSKTEQAKAKVIQSRYEYQKSIYYLDYLREKGTKDEN